jgi:4'-phosphopantetheinyl transferase
LPERSIMDVLYTRIPKRLPTACYNEFVSLLPQDMQEKNARFREWKDRLLHLGGKLLLLEALQRLGLNDQCLNQVKYSPYNRPYIKENIDFNISHSGEYVVCAVASNMQIGIDIEEIKPVDFPDFDNVMTMAEWENIHHATDPLRAFYTHWTIKESVIKADSRGLTVPLTDINIHPQFAELEGKIWYLNELSIDDNYCLSIATDKTCAPKPLKHNLFL